MVIESELLDDTLYLIMRGALDEATANYTRNMLDKYLSSNTYSQVVLELADLEFMDSTGIGVLIGRYKLLKNKNKPIYISNPSNTIEKIFNMSGIYEIMPKIS